MTGWPSIRGSTKLLVGVSSRSMSLISIGDLLTNSRDTLISGLLIGRFYSEDGHPTEALLQTQILLAEGQQMKAQAEAGKLHFPSCNSEWNAAGAGRVWCTTKRYANGLSRSNINKPTVSCSCIFNLLSMFNINSVDLLII